MCGRFALTDRPEGVEALFGVDVEDFPPRYNIAPTQPVLMVVGGAARPQGSNLPDRRALLVRWGFIPSWAKNPKDMPLLINARSETAAGKAAFRAAMRHRRALLPASGFYEWRRGGKGRAQAYWVRPRSGGLIAFAGLMETYSEPGGSEIDTGAILTTAASRDLADIHHRMPAVIRPEHFSRWLDCVRSEPRDVADLLAPVEEGFFEVTPVSGKVNKVANTGPEVQERVEPEVIEEEVAERAEQLRLF
ncbi:SOS response-associated peptidase [Chelativorans xinjiangense]|uniref:SOS response-associated peptidase n=1 Tax=Chelativorans xinjiangense TaxID=2681485 RepID=UPI0013574182|nr:SOS response-associated peptidase [Chelativorans xinjiangense]